MSELIPPHRQEAIMHRKRDYHEQEVDFFLDVVDFHNKYGIAYVGESRNLPADGTLRLARIIHMQEELQEYVKAVQNDDKAAALDALVDLVYVALGTAHFHGWNFTEAWERVHIANMQKERVDSAADSKRGTEFDIVKPEGWLAPNLEDLV